MSPACLLRLFMALLLLLVAPSAADELPAADVPTLLWSAANGTAEELFPVANITEDDDAIKRIWHELYPNDPAGLTDRLLKETPLSRPRRWNETEAAAAAIADDYDYRPIGAGDGNAEQPTTNTTDGKPTTTPPRATTTAVVAQTADNDTTRATVPSLGDSNNQSAAATTGNRTETAAARRVDFWTLGSICASGVMLVICVLLFSCPWRVLTSVHNSTHRNVCLSLLVLQLAYLATAHCAPSRLLTWLVHSALQWLFLWLLLDAYRLYLTLVQLLHTRRQNFKFHVVGFGAPALIVAAAGFVWPNEFENENFAVVRPSQTVVLLVVYAPAALAAIATVALNVLTASIALTKCSLGSDRVSSGARSGCVLVLLLVVCWVCALLPVYATHLLPQHITILHALFAALNLICAVYIFVVYFVLCARVQSQLRACLPQCHERQHQQQFRSPSNSHTPPPSHRHIPKPLLEHLLSPPRLDMSMTHQVSEPMCLVEDNAVYLLPEWPMSETPPNNAALPNRTDVCFSQPISTDEGAPEESPWVDQVLREAASTLSRRP